MAESLAFYRLKDLPVKQHHKVKLRHKISVISKLTKHIMFKTAGTVNVPKTLPYKVFDFIVFFFFSKRITIFLFIVLPPECCKCQLLLSGRF